jgi:cold shock CspA family protein
MQKRFEGTVIWYDPQNAYGIIRLRSGNKTVSIVNSQVHHSRAAGIRSLHVGQDVSFEIVNTEARNLRIHPGD